MKDKRIKEIQLQNIKNLREVLERRLGKDKGGFLTDLIVKDGVEKQLEKQLEEYEELEKEKK